MSFARLLPSLRSAFPGAAARDAALLVSGSAALAVAAAAVAFTPLDVVDPRLWIASVPFFGLLGAGALRARRAP